MRTIKRKTVELPPNLENSQLLNDKQVAKLTGRALQTVRNDRFNRQGIPYVRVGRSIRYKVQDVLNFIQKNRIETT